jgi:hypothetical protein
MVRDGDRASPTGPEAAVAAQRLPQSHRCVSIRRSMCFPAGKVCVCDGGVPSVLDRPSAYTRMNVRYRYRCQSSSQRTVVAPAQARGSYQGTGPAAGDTPRVALLFECVQPVFQLLEGCRRAFAGDRVGLPGDQIEACCIRQGTGTVPDDIPIGGPMHPLPADWRPPAARAGETVPRRRGRISIRERRPARCRLPESRHASAATALQQIGLRHRPPSVRLRRVVRILHGGGPARGRAGRDCSGRCVRSARGCDRALREPIGRIHHHHSENVGAVEPIDAEMLEQFARPMGGRFSLGQVAVES